MISGQLGLRVVTTSAKPTSRHLQPKRRCEIGSLIIEPAIRCGTPEQTRGITVQETRSWRRAKASGNKGRAVVGLRRASSELEPPPITRSGQWTELHVDRRRRINECAEFELAVRELDAEHRNIVSVLVGCVTPVGVVEELPARVDADLGSGVGAG